MNKDQVKGGLKRAKGKVQEVAGRAVGNKDLQARGGANQALGKTQKGLWRREADGPEEQPLTHSISPALRNHSDAGFLSTTRQICQ